MGGPSHFAKAFRYRELNPHSEMFSFGEEYADRGGSLLLLGFSLPHGGQGRRAPQGAEPRVARGAFFSFENGA